MTRSSETIRDYSFLSLPTSALQAHADCSPPYDPDDALIDWLAGLIDADGCFCVSRAGDASCEITMHTKEVQTLYFVKERWNGVVQKRNNSESFRWRLHKRDAMTRLCLMLNGRLQSTSTQMQFSKVCDTLHLPYQTATSLNAQNAWLAGFFCAEGHFNLNGNQSHLGIVQRERIILDSIASIWGGTVYFEKSWSGFAWYVTSKRELALILAYFQVNALRNPYKTAKLKGFERYLRYLERGGRSFT